MAVALSRAGKLRHQVGRWERTLTHFSSVQSLSRADSLRPHELQHSRPPCPSPTPRVPSDSRPSSPWCHPAISSSVISFSSCPQSLTASESFPMSQLFAWGGQSTGVSALASFFPKNSQGWSPLGWTGWISLHSTGLSGVFSNTTVQKHQFFGGQPLYVPTLTPIYDYWKNHSFDCTDLCQQSGVSPFNMQPRFVSFPFKEQVSFNFVAAVPSAVILEPKKIKSVTVSTFPHLFALKWWDWMPGS